MEAVQHEKEHEDDIFSDKYLERLSITPRGDTKDGQRIAKASDEEHRRHRQHKHQYFSKSWRPFSPDAPLDDEWFIVNPDILSEDDPRYLCEMCRHLNFDVLFTKRGVPGNSRPSLPTQIRFKGLWKVMEQANGCAFCGLLRRKILDEGMVSQLADSEIQQGEFYINAIDEGPGYAIRLEIELEWDMETIGRFVVQRVEEEARQPLAGRFVQQNQADMNRLREWLQVCEETHRSSDQNLELDVGLTSLRVIDIETSCVREVNTPFRYACLSYVWGKGSQTQYTTVTKDSLEAPQGLQKFDLPRTISDAIRVTKEAGLRYLWVDALCILQDEPEDKAKIISRMGPIYGGATMTIVASTNVDPHDGLAGMGTAHRSVAQDAVKIQGMTLAVGLHDPRQPIPDIESSVWDSRAWTFQERALSKRSVYFTRSQMVFKCIHGATMLEEIVPTPDPAFQHSTIEDRVQPDLLVLVWCHTSLSRFSNKGFTMREADLVMMMSEDIDLDKMDPEEREKRAPVFNITVDVPLDFMNTLGDNNGSTPWDLYRRAVDDYTKRKLSWQSDAVDAFSGVEHIIRQGTNTKFWYGLPSFAFEQALLWQAGEPLQVRRKNGKAIFPSWSWAAWQGHVFYRGRGWKNSVVWDPVSVVRWCVREKPEWFNNKFREEGNKTEDEVEAHEKKVAEASLLLRELDARSLHHLDAVGQDGWVMGQDEEYNRHIYTHDAYRGVKFTYPVSLPGQSIDDRPDSNGTLFFHAHVVPITSCDMQQPSFKMNIEDGFFQLGVNDESRSVNYRAPWQRIVYHQGYRAGFLSLNTSSLPADDDGCDYHLAAISRGSLSTVPPPPPGWDAYWSTGPCSVQDFLFDEQWRTGLENVRVPDETVEPSADGMTGSMKKQNENGDPHWDMGRFGGITVWDVYDVLLLKTQNGVSSRMGAGKVNLCAFAAARPEEMLVQLV
ncbi:hypothetical protein ColLi_01963 [Colletotrichum liriopes]|uniref:Heterokaryon incompatibility domain-containing protein n=1 Tax=Colletotrichum liriopes TaxID=708192 RepID=A0AA37GEE4_9PEZI|nr:hypothetical protein ColLi_01963 [Colletotrichum liriopes]